MSPTDPLWGLPDPDTAPEFYADVTAKRFFAWIVDTVLILLLSVLALPFTAFMGVFFFAAIFFMVAIMYRIVTLSRASATPGMRFVAIEIRKNDGGRLDNATAILHTLLYTFFTSSFVLQVISVGMMLMTARGQGLHDMLLGTAAVNKSRSF